MHPPPGCKRSQAKVRHKLQVDIRSYQRHRVEGTVCLEGRDICQWCDSATRSPLGGIEVTGIFQKANRTSTGGLEKDGNASAGGLIVDNFCHSLTQLAMSYRAISRSTPRNDLKRAWGCGMVVEQEYAHLEECVYRTLNCI
ncbi:uncharacterized protein CIMG_12441 [Coccidioides immitis RS]|uniref:Uncharacterized protein n=1 Tax=Coccidioides immitis (strain RS) TaxID=246410 RepID=A0A0D8JSY9_COCIM|nr:uncharacterized protein CIMG_12441 [Coccidioides immitis RS]KJF60402.1 hypothetical protein CIMG_12441 [Coccidioides immitis RS]